MAYSQQGEKLSFAKAGLAAVDKDLRDFLECYSYKVF